jgi:hypothetical protein
LGEAQFAPTVGIADEFHPVELDDAALEKVADLPRLTGVALAK